LQCSFWVFSIRTKRHLNCEERIKNLLIVISDINSYFRKDKKLKKIKMESFFDSKNLLEIIKKWKTHLTVIVIIAIILGAIFSGKTFVTPLYKSYAVIYPANINAYSEESNTEQMLQILQSQDITDSIISFFKLGEHYNIDPEYKYYKTAIINEYKDKVSINKTPYESVMIEVLDKDPVLAKEMVEKIIYYFNKKVDNLHKDKYREIADMVEMQLSRKNRLLDSLKQVKAFLGTEKGIFEYENMAREITEGYLGTVDGGNAKVNKKEAIRLFNNMAKYSGELIEVDKMIIDETYKYAQIQKDYDNARKFLDADLSYTNIITHPFVADKKSYPIRWLIVVITAIAAFVFALLIIFIIENKNRKNI
jgi:capsular polysaccharide biosynthesis protein